MTFFTYSAIYNAIYIRQSFQTIKSSFPDSWM